MVDILSLIATAAISSLLGSGAIMAIFQQWWKGTQDERLERVRSELLRKNDELKLEQQRLSDELKTKFSVLHERRAEVMAEVQRLLVAAYDAFGYFRKPFEGYEALQPIDKMMKSAVEATNNFRIYYLSTRQLFPPSIAQRLDDVNERLVLAATMYFKAREVDHQSESDAYAATLSTISSQDPRQLLQPIESEFRRLYGVTD